MTLLVEFGFSNGASVPDDIFILDDPAEGILGTSMLADVDILADYSDRIMELNVDHQSTRVVGPVLEYQARTASLTLFNDDGELDPYTIEAAGLTAPGVVLRIRKTHNGITYPLFYGYVDSWQPVHRHPTHATVTVTATDGMSLLQAKNWAPMVSPSYAGDDAGTRISRILTAAGWSAVARDVAVGDSTLAATDLEGSPLDEIQETAKSEVGEFYIEPDGTAYFRNRHAVMSESRSITSQATFGTDTAAGEIMYVDRPGMSWDRTQLINSIRATRDGGVEQVSTDTDSLARYGEYSTSQTVLLADDVAVKEWTQYVLAQDKTPESRFTSLTLEGALVPDTTMPQALGRRFGDRITVVRRPPGGIVDSREVYIRSVSHSWNARQPLHWQTVWSLQPVAKYPFLILDHASQGAVGTTNVLAF